MIRKSMLIMLAMVLMGCGPARDDVITEIRTYGALFQRIIDHVDSTTDSPLLVGSARPTGADCGMLGGGDQSFGFSVRLIPAHDLTETEAITALENLLGGPFTEDGRSDLGVSQGVAGRIILSSGLSVNTVDLYSWFSTLSDGRFRWVDVSWSSDCIDPEPRDWLDDGFSSVDRKELIPLIPQPEY